MPGDTFLLDTSVWLEVLPPRRQNTDLRDRVDALLAADAVATTGMVRLELLGGARSSEDWDRLNLMLNALHRFPVSEESCQDAAKMGFDLRRQGITVPFTNLLIGAVTIQAGAVLLHRDRHFDLIASHLPLKVESYVTA